MRMKSYHLNGALCKLMSALPKEALIIIRDPNRDEDFKLSGSKMVKKKNLDKTILKIEFSFFLAQRYFLISTRKVT